MADFGQLQGEEQTFLSRDGVASFLHAVSWSSDLDDVSLDLDRVGAGVSIIRVLLAHLRLFGGATGEIGLMLAALGVSQVGAIVLMDGEAETTFEGADVVFEEVRVFVEVDGLQGEFTQTFTSVGVGGALGGDATTSELRAGAVLVIHCGVRCGLFC